MRALIAAATGLALAFALVLTLTALGTPTGKTSPKPKRTIKHRVTCLHLSSLKQCL